MVTFGVAEVAPATESLPTLDRDEALCSLLREPVEQLSAAHAPLVMCTDAHPFAAAAHRAFYAHYPLVLSPDAVWFCLAQGFVHHVALNAERLRERFVRFAGKAKLLVERPDFVLGRVNPWPEVFADFAKQIAAHVGRLRDLVVADFSTTGPTERAAFEVVLMDAFEPYFKYELAIGCGIPSITLLGTPEDWRSLRRRAAMLSEFELSTWTDALLPVLDEIVATAEGRVDRAFWRSFFRYESASGGHEMTGWIQLLFPYLVHREYAPDPQPSVAPAREYTVADIVVLSSAEGRRRTSALVRNPHMLAWKRGVRAAEARAARGEWLSWNNSRGPSLEAIPSGLASAPVHVIDRRDRSECDLRFVAGLLGVTQDPTTLALKPDFGWAIVHEPAHSNL